MDIRISLMAATALLALAVGPAWSATICVNPNSARCEATIQGAVDIAASRDTIKVASGFYNENVTVPGALTGLEIRGAGGTVLDGDTPLTGVALTVNADGVTVKGFAIQNGQAVALIMNGDGGSIRNMHIQGPEGDCVNVNGDDTLVKGNTLQGCGDKAIEVSADDVDIENNDISQCDNGCINIVGDGFVVERNEIHIAENSNLIVFVGDDGEIVNNKMSNAGSHAIAGNGDDTLISGNEISNATGAIDIDGANPVVTRNRAKDFNGGGEAFLIDCNTLCNNALVSTNRIEHVSNDTYGLEVSATVDGMLVEKNTIRDIEDSILAVRGAGMVTARNNSLSTSGGDSGTPCVDVQGTGAHLVSKNKIANCHGDGVYATGDGHTIDRNSIRDTLEDGVSVDSGNNISVTDNNIRNALGVGLEAEASTGTTITGNKVSTVRMGLCDESTGTVRMNNTVSKARFPDQLNSGNACPID